MLNDIVVPAATDMFVARLSDTRLMVTTDEMIMLSMESAGIDAGITELMKDIPAFAVSRYAACSSLHFQQQTTDHGIRSNSRSSNV